MENKLFLIVLIFVYRGFSAITTIGKQLRFGWRSYADLFFRNFCLICCSVGCWVSMYWRIFAIFSRSRSRLAVAFCCISFCLFVLGLKACDIGLHIVKMDNLAD
jgi:hypothetical protein